MEDISVISLKVEPASDNFEEGSWNSIAPGMEDSKDFIYPDNETDDSFITPDIEETAAFIDFLVWQSV